jgi:hypothetical protein
MSACTFATFGKTARHLHNVLSKVDERKTGPCIFIQVHQVRKRLVLQWHTVVNVSDRVAFTESKE